MSRRPITDYLNAYGQHGESGPPSWKKRHPAGAINLSSTGPGKAVDSQPLTKGAGPDLQTGNVAPTPFVPPPDPLYEQQLGALDKNRTATLAGLQNQRTQGLASYGYNVTTDSAGNPTSATFDPNNPYSQAALLRKHTEQSRTGNTNRFASAGQLYAGSLQNAQDETQQQFNEGDSALSRAALAFVLNNNAQMNEARNNYELDAGQASADRLGRIPTNALADFTTAAKPGIVTTGKDGKKPESYASRAKTFQLTYKKRKGKH